MHPFLHKKDHEAHHYYIIDISLDLSTPQHVASALHVEYIGPVADLGYHLFRRPKQRQQQQGEPGHDPVLQRLSSLQSSARLNKRDATLALAVRDVSKQVPTRRLVKRSLPDQLGIVDPMFTIQWHLHNALYKGHDLNVTGLWQEGITGKGVTVALIDDGLDFTHEALRDNFLLKGSYDFNNHTKHPYPWKNDDTHGTRCAGEVAAAKNHMCGVGVAYDAKVSGIRILSGHLTQDEEALALYYANQVNDIYSCSWGPPDNGKSMDAPSNVVKRAFVKSIQQGRKGKGALFVFATGNGGAHDDNCNFDGYTNSPYTMTIGAVDWKDEHPIYSEKCSAQLAVAYSSGGGEYLHTVDVRNQCAHTHGGTSAAAPLVSGVMALVLSVRPDLTWRDAQYLLVEAATPFNLNHESWTVNAVGRLYSHTFGYGKIDAYRIVHHAKTFQLVGPPLQLEQDTISVNQDIPQDYHGINSTMDITRDYLLAKGFKRLEHLTVRINIQHERRGDVQVHLISPHGIVSILSPGRSNDDSDEGFSNWEFMSVAHWGEDPVGTWTLHVKDAVHPEFGGVFVDWTLKLWGEGVMQASTTTTTTTTSIIQQEAPLPTASNPHAQLSKIIKKPPPPVEESAQTVTVTQTVFTSVSQPTIYLQKTVDASTPAQLVTPITFVTVLGAALTLTVMVFIGAMVYMKRRSSSHASSDYRFKPLPKILPDDQHSAKDLLFDTLSIDEQDDEEAL